jgi:hypothetical protein
MRLFMAISISDIQHKVTQLNDTQHDGTKHYGLIYDNQHNDTQHDGTEHNGLIYDTEHKRHSA